MTLVLKHPVQSWVTSHGSHHFDTNRHGQAVQYRRTHSLRLNTTRDTVEDDHPDAVDRNRVSRPQRPFDHSGPRRDQPRAGHRPTQGALGSEPLNRAGKERTSWRKKWALGRRPHRRFPDGKNKTLHSSVLPAMVPDLWQSNKDEPLPTGLSSWEDFLGVSLEDPALSHPQGRSQSSDQSSSHLIHSIRDLFPSVSTTDGTRNTFRTKQNERSARRQPSLDGLVPLSDLFFRGSNETEPDPHPRRPQPRNAAIKGRYKNRTVPLPHRVIQNSQRQGPADKVKPTRGGKRFRPSPRTQSYGAGPRKLQGRRLFRRGTEVYVNGVCLVADPPQRSVVLTYDSETDDWASVITLNTAEFGPFLHRESIRKMSEAERALYCEYWVHAAIKWKVCPRDLQCIVEAHLHRNETADDNAAVMDESNMDTSESNDTVSEEDQNSDSEDDETSTEDLGLDAFFESVEKLFTDVSPRSLPARETSKRSIKALDPPKGFGKPPEENDSNKPSVRKGFFGAVVTSTQSIAVSREDLESGTERDGMLPIQNVFLNAILMMTTEVYDLDVSVSQFELVDAGLGLTTVNVEYTVCNRVPMTAAYLQHRLKQIGAAVNNEYFLFLVAKAAKTETGWSEDVREQVVNECLLADDDLKGEDRPSDTKGVQRAIGPSPERQREEVDPDYSVVNASRSPYGGEIGQLLLKAICEHAKERRPKVIAIGDVHGCLEELQDLVRECDFRPGDLIIPLGDLVCKGPSSLEVVEMLRELGAVAICGNHDFEVRRWKKAISFGIPWQTSGPDHFHIASQLSEADNKWIEKLPWFISSDDLNALFVHAGFVSGIRLAKQNPRLMTNMRSILPDGTVTSKFFNNWPWARLWDGPQTVLFGHDADRGLQQYEHAIGLDTGCVYGGRLTACILPEKRFVSVSARRQYVKYRRKHYD